MISPSDPHSKNAAEAVDRLVWAIDRRWSASAEYLRACADNPDADPTRAREAYEDVRDALDALADVQSAAAMRILAILDEHNPRALPALAQALRQLAAPARHVRGNR